ncbi:hypothetical protein DFJ77DRAFT_551995 [Powellomyces hirtus]|nr:hypothetical protein DFJ77DRAFT_551995 [Powellomyces hirtus]
MPRFLAGRCSNGCLVNLVCETNINELPRHDLHRYNGCRHDIASPTKAPTWHNEGVSSVLEQTFSFRHETPTCPSSPEILSAQPLMDNFQAVAQAMDCSPLISRKQPGPANHGEDRCRSANAYNQPGRNGRRTSDTSTTISSRIERATPSDRDPTPDGDFSDEYTETRQCSVTTFVKTEEFAEAEVPMSVSRSVTPEPRPRRVCGTCQRSFTTSGHLARHMRIHTGVKPYKCLLTGCDSKFSRQDNMMQHYRTHLLKLQRADNSHYVVEVQNLHELQRGQRNKATRGANAETSHRSSLIANHAPTPPPTTPTRRKNSKHRFQEKSSKIPAREYEDSSDNDVPDTPTKTPRKRTRDLVQRPNSDIMPVQDIMARNLNPKRRKKAA